jgi:putative transposase
MDATDNELVEIQYYECCVVDLYNGHRPHRALALTPPRATRPPVAPATEWGKTRVQRRDRLGGVVHEYVLAA